MKIRLGFVSNSSSSSFVLYKPSMTEDQIDAVRNHADKYGKIEDHEIRYSIYNNSLEVDFRDRWKISETEHTMQLNTSMDNFDMGAFLKYLEVPASAILSCEWN